jgi:predicted NUDIX family phosphoesterase
MEDTHEAKMIKGLESEAARLKGLLEKRGAKRPFIIEFSGAPKAGKTRAISVLELFLKRNGLKTEVFVERASIAPIKAKGHLYFNVWVSCASLQGTLEALFRDVDIFILDRGIFDALVWNELLKTTGKMTEEEALQVDNFFTMNRWTELIDLVFVMTCTPAKSIEREYADQLTTKRGTIMSETTLGHIAEATQKTIRERSAEFKIVEIDTTELSTRDCVAQIARETLKALGDFLDEAVCVIPAQSVSLPPRGFIEEKSTMKPFLDAVTSQRTFVPRSEAESNPNYIQPIPMAILEYKDEILVLKRNKPGHALHDKYDVWSGGHVNRSDDGVDILLNALNREITEEVFIKEAYELDPTPIALVRTDEDARASLHVGVLYKLRLKSDDVALAMNQKEFRATRGSSMSGKLIPTKDLSSVYREMGDWSKFVAEKLWPDGVEAAKGPSLFNQLPIPDHSKS